MRKWCFKRPEPISYLTTTEQNDTFIFAPIYDHSDWLKFVRIETAPELYYSRTEKIILEKICNKSELNI